MLETIREFGLERLAASGETAAIAARHATWCVTLADEIRSSGGLSHGLGLAILEAEYPNLRAALGWLLARGETTVALHLAGLLAEFWMRHGHWTEGEAWLERVLAADDGGATTATGSCGCTSHEQCATHGPGAFCVTFTPGGSCICGGATTFCATPR